jgi:hypothetical protein
VNRLIPPFYVVPKDRGVWRVTLSKPWAAITALALMGAALPGAAASTIVSIADTNSGTGYVLQLPASSPSMFGGVLAASWSTTNAYTGVTIQADVYGSQSGTAYLMSQIGTGTTAAEQIASAGYTAAATAGSLTTLFSGLSLPSGTYFLVLAGPTTPNLNDWEIPPSPVITTDAATTLGSFFGAANNPPNQTTVNLAYPPGSNFSTLGGDPVFQVTGTLASAAPEPTTCGFVGTALMGLFIAALRKRRSSIGAR